MRAFKNFRTFQDHVSAFHRGPGVQDGDNGTVGDGEDGTVEFGGEVGIGGETNAFQFCLQPLSVRAQLQKSSALFLLGLKEKHKLTQVALQGVIDGATALVQCRQDVLRSQIMSILSTEDVPSSVTSRLTECLSDDGMFGRPFLGLETHHQQINYYRTNFHLIVSLYYPAHKYLIIHVLCGLHFVGTCSCTTRRTASLERERL